MSTLADYENLSSDDSETSRAAMQALIDSGAAWRLEGSIGRAAMAAIENGLCAVGTEPHRDYFGNLIPSRGMLDPGSMGTVEYMEARGYQLAQ
jgi:hypothetical protein